MHCLLSLFCLIESSTQYDIVDRDEHKLDDVADKADHNEAHSASLQDFHVFYLHRENTY